MIPNLFRSFSELNKNATELTHIQNHVIEFLYMQQKAVNIKDISIGLNIAKQSLTHIIHQLERKGYLVKRPDERDKRAVLVSLTAKGKEQEQKKWTEMLQKLTTNLNKLSEEEKIDLAFSLHKVNMLLNKLAD